MLISGLKGRYKVGAALGTGGMATVHRATTVGSGERVAVKVLHPHLHKDRSIAKAFRDEARLAQALEHPNIVRVIDISADGSAPALVMELIDGGSLLELAYASWNRGDRVPPPVASAIVLDVLAALERAHEAVDAAGAPAPVIHRDVSPHNVMVGKDGVARLTDFGIARIGDETGSTMTGKVKGKLAYMAPEQFSGKRASARSDIYGAGVILWELLASERLFEGELAELVAKAVNTDRSSLTLAKREVSTEVDAIVLRALATDPTERFSAAAVMADALRTAIVPASRADVAAWVESVAVDVPEGPQSSAEPPPSSRVETTRKPKIAPASVPLWRKLAPIVVPVAAIASVIVWAVTRSPAITPEPSPAGATGEAQSPPSTTVVAPVPPGPTSSNTDDDPLPTSAPIESQHVRPTAAPVASNQPTTSETVSPPAPPTTDPVSTRGTATTSSGALAPFDRKELDRATSAWVNGKIGCQGQQAVRVIFRPNGSIDVIGMMGPESECAAAKMRGLLGSTKPFDGKLQSVDFGFSAPPPAD